MTTITMSFFCDLYGTYAPLSITAIVLDSNKLILSQHGGPSLSSAFYIARQSSVRTHKNATFQINGDTDNRTIQLIHQLNQFFQENNLSPRHLESCLLFMYSPDGTIEKITISIANEDSPLKFICEHDATKRLMSTDDEAVAKQARSNLWHNYAKPVVKVVAISAATVTAIAATTVYVAWRKRWIQNSWNYIVGNPVDEKSPKYQQ